LHDCLVAIRECMVQVGLRAQTTALDLLSNNLANLNTAGFKETKTFYTVLDQAMEDPQRSALNRAINTQTVAAQGALVQSDGSLLSTGRDLDIALSGVGLLTVDTARGVRYTRNGSLHLGKNSALSTAEGDTVLGENGPIRLGEGKIQIDAEGNVFLAGTRVDRLKLVTFDDPGALGREGNSLLVPLSDAAKARPAQPQVNQGYLEQSNVNAIASVVNLVGILRHFEAVQKSVTLIMNDINTKAIEKLGR